MPLAGCIRWYFPTIKTKPLELLYMVDKGLHKIIYIYVYVHNSIVVRAVTTFGSFFKWI